MKKNNLFILVSALFLFVSCGTDTGNPSMLPGSDPFIGQPISSQVASILCRKIRTCFPINLSSCETKIRIVPNISTALGLNEATYSHLNAIQSAINSSVLSVDQTQGTLCLNQIYQASCSDTDIQQSYASTDPENLDNAYRMLSLSPTCAQFIF
jgi:hypothetical protein